MQPEPRNNNNDNNILSFTYLLIDLLCLDFGACTVRVRIVLHQSNHSWNDQISIWNLKVYIVI